MLKLIPKKKNNSNIAIQKQFEKDQQEQMRKNWKEKMNDKIKQNVDNINKENPTTDDNRPKPTIINPTIRGVKKKYAANGTKLIKRIKK